MKKIFVTRRIPEIGLKILQDQGYEVDIYPKDGVPSQAELLQNLQAKPYDAVLTLLTDKVDAAFLDAAPAAKIISNYAVGFNNIDVAEAKRRGVAVANTRGASSDSVAEFTVALILALSTRLVEGDKFVRAGKFEGWSPMLFLGTDLKGKTLGLVGAGNIGSQVAFLAARGLGMKIVYHDIVRNEKIEKECGAMYEETFENVLKDADFVTLHVPLLPSTHHFISAEHLKLMKPTAFIVNTSRGPVVDENALVAALKSKVIAGAALDVFEFEPNLAAGLAELSNVVLTPHIASSRPTTRNEMSRLAAENIVDFFDGKTPNGLVQ